MDEKESMAMKMREEAMRPIEDDFDNYMKKVDLVESVLKRLASGNPMVSNTAMKEADILLKGKEVNFNEDDVHVKKSRTIINQQAFDKFDDKDDGQSTMQPNEFMKQVEEDSKRRAEDRRLRKKESDRHKNEGNKAFREQKYAKALVCYDKAIEILKDSCILYCNRSLTYLKLGLAEKALRDAEMSLKANEKSLRGFIYKAQALWHLGKDKESQEVIEEASRVLPDQEEYLKGVFDEWETAPGRVGRNDEDEF
uniref:Uncharacterized protein n=1 Tax=Lygus hesperus TaxID=30085 RepID=A0A0A9Y2T4_LYGHE